MLQTTQDSGGPRQPWHDLHCRIDGPAAYDVLTNFEQRWKKATRWHDDELIEIGRISWILGPTKETRPQGDPHLMVSEDEDPETWHVQVRILSQKQEMSFCSLNPVRYSHEEVKNRL